jgi:hypothetical protein
VSFRHAAILILSLLTASCAQSGKDPYAGWSLYVGPGDLFAVRYITPPWQECSGTDYEADCHECPAHLLNATVCGETGQSVTLWIPPRLLDPEYLLIPPFKLEVTWFASDLTALDAARWERNTMAAAGLDILIEPRAVTLHDGTVAAETGYHGPMHIITQDDPVERPDERGFRVVWVVEGGTAYRVALDTAVAISLPEARDMLASFTLDPPVEE